MKGTIKSSKKSDVAQAVSEVTAGLTGAKGIIFMCDYVRLAAVAKELSERLPEAEVIGTAGTVYHNTTIGDKNLLVVSAIMDDAEISSGLIRNLSTDPLSDIHFLAESVKSVSPKKDSTVCIEFCTSNEEVLVSTMNVILEPTGVSLAGGTVVGAPEGKSSLVAFAGEVYEDACVYMVIKNSSGKALVIRENIYERADGPAHVATKVKPSNKELTELDNRPAADVYSAETGVPKNKIVDNVLTSPLGRVVDNEIYIASLNGVLPNGAITNYKRINKNDSLYILKLMDYRGITENTRGRIKQAIPHPSMIFAINCIYRYLLFVNDGYLDEFLSNMAGLGAFAGYIGGGEQYNRQHVNQTMVCAVFE